MDSDSWTDLLSLKVQIFNGDSQPWLDMGLPEERLQPMDGGYVSDQLDEDVEGGEGQASNFLENFAYESEDSEGGIV